MEIYDELFFYIGNNFLSNKDVINIYLTNHRFKKIYYKLIFGYSGIFIYNKYADEIVSNISNKVKEKTLKMNLRIISYNSSYIMINKMCRNILDICFSFGYSKKYFNVKNKTKTSIITLEKGLLNRINYATLENAKIKLKNYPNKIYRVKQSNIFNQSSYSNIKNRTKYMKNLFKFSYAIII